MTMTWLACILVACMAVQEAHAFYTEEGPLNLINSKKDFDQKVLQAPEPAVVEFYANWCGHCKNLAPTIEKLAARLEGIIPVFAVDCDQEGNKPVCKDQSVRGFPTIKLFPDKQQHNPYTNKLYKDSVDYTGGRTAKAMADAAFALLPDQYIQRLSSAADLESFQGNSTTPAAVLITTKPASSPLFKSLSLRFKGRMAFAEAQDTVADVAAALSVETYPKLVLIPKPGEEEIVHYDGNFKAKELVPFLEEHALPEGERDARSSSSDSKEGAGKKQQQRRLFEPEQLQLADLQGRISEQEAAWLVAIFGGTNETCAEAVSAWASAVDKLGGLTKAGSLFLQASDRSEAGSLGVDAAALGEEPCRPQVLLLPFGDKEDEDWLVFKGALEAKALQQFALSAFPSNLRRLTSATFQQALGMQPHRPKMVLVTDKATTPPVFAALAANFVPRGMDFFDVHASEAEVLQQFGVAKPPALVLALLMPGTAGDEEGQHRVALQHYEGPLKYPSMASFAEQILEAMDEELRGRSGGTSEAAALIEEVTDQEAFEQRCCKKLGLCIIALLDTAAAAAEQLAALRAVAAQKSHLPLHYIWVDAAKQPGLLSQFGLSRSRAPAVVAFSGSKRRFAVHTGDLTVASLGRFFDEVVSGKASTAQLQEAPRIVDGGEEADQAAEEAPLIEEEFDLADILSEAIDEDAPGKSKADLIADIDAKLQEEEAQRSRQSSPAGKSESRRKRKKKRAKKLASSKSEL